MHLKFQPTKAAFHLMHNPDDQVNTANQGHFITVIRRAMLKLRKVRCSPDLLLEHARLLESKNALYPLRRGVVTTFTVAAGGQSFVKENLIQGQFPRRAFVAMVTNVYTDLMRTIGLLNSSRGRGIFYTDFVQGAKVIFGFDFMADMAEGFHLDRVKYGSLQLEGQYGQALTQAVNVIVYAEYDNLFQVDRSRNVVADFAST